MMGAAGGYNAGVRLHIVGVGVCVFLVFGAVACRGESRRVGADVGDAGGGIGAASYANERLGIALALPAGWTARASRDYVLELEPAGALGAGRREISVDVPDLPPHIPGLIPMGLVKNGYVECHWIKPPSCVSSGISCTPRAAWSCGGTSWGDV